MNFRTLALFGLCMVLLNFAALDVYVNHVAVPGATILVHGSTTLNTSTLEAVVVGEDINGTNTTDSEGSFDIYLTAPSEEGSYEITVTNTEGDSRTLMMLVSNVSSATITVLGSPTYTTGTTFQVNISVLNSSGAPLLNHALPTLHIFRPMSGMDESWTLLNNSPTTGSNGAVIYNITIPSLASGPYALVVEDSATTSPFVFDVKPGDTGIEFSIIPQTDSEVDSQVFGANSNVTLKATLKYGNGTMISGATVTAYVVKPDGSASLKTLVATDFDGMYTSTFTGTSQSGTYVVNAKAVYGSGTFKRTTSFDVGLIQVQISPEDTKFFKEGEMGGKEVIRPGAEAGFVVMVKNLSTGEFIEGSADGSGAGTVNCSAISLASVVRVNDSTEVSVSNFGTSTTTYFGGTSCYINFTAPSTSAVYRLDANVLWDGENTTGIAFLPVQTFILRVQSVAEMVEGDMQFQQMFTPGSNATFSIVAINSSDASLDGSNVTDIAVVALFNLPTGQEIEVSSLNEVANNTADTLKITLPDSPTDAYILTISATVNDGTTSETVTGDVFFFSKYVVGFLQPASSGTGGGGFTGTEGNGGASACTGTESFVGNVMLASTGEALDNVWLNAAPQMMMEEASGKMVTDCISFAENSSSDGQIFTSVTFDDDCDYSGFYFFLTNVTYSDDNGAHTDSLPGFFQCVDMGGDVAFDPEQDGWSISSTGKINVTATGVQYLNGTNVTGTIEVLELRIYEMGSPKFLSPATSLTFPVVNGEASFQLSPQNFTNGVANITRWAGSSAQVEGELEVCDASDMCTIFETGIPVESATEVWVWSSGGSATFVVGQNVTLDVYARTNLSAAGFSAKFEKDGVPGGIAAPGVYAGLVSDGWNVPSDAGKEHWQVNITTPSGVQKGTVSVALTMTDEVSGEQIRRSVYGSVQSATLGITQAGIAFYGNSSTFGSIDMPGYNESLVAEGWDVAWLKTNFSITDTPPFSQMSFLSNFTVTSWSNGGEEASLINASKKILCMDTNDDDVPDTLFVRDTTYFNSTYNRSAYTRANSSSRSMGQKIYYWELYGCGYGKVVNANDNSLNSWVGEFGVNQNAMIPYIVKQGSNPVSGVTVNISSIYAERDEGYGLGSQLASSQYTITSAVTDSNGVAWVTLNVSTSGRYKLFWKINGSVNDSATIETASQFEARYIRGNGQLLYEWGNGIATASLTNASAGAGSLMCSAGGCPEVFNGSISNFYGLGPMYVAVNATSELLTASLLGLNATCPDEEMGVCKTNSSEINFVNESGNVLGYDLLSFAIGGRAVGTTSRNYSFYLREPNYGNQRTVSSTQTVTLKICADEVTPSESNEYVPLSNANISALYIKEYPFNSPPVIVTLNMFDPVTGASASVIPLQPDGCTAFRTNRTTGSWSFGMNDLRANITAVIDGNVVTESAYVANLNRGG